MVDSFPDAHAAGLGNLVCLEDHSSSLGFLPFPWECPVHGEVEPRGCPPAFLSRAPGGRCLGEQVRLSVASALST